MVGAQSCFTSMVPGEVAGQDRALLGAFTILV
jgi:hypothetical protein